MAYPDFVRAPVGIPPDGEAVVDGKNVVRVRGTMWSLESKAAEDAGGEDVSGLPVSRGKNLIGGTGDLTRCTHGQRNPAVADRFGFWKRTRRRPSWMSMSASRDSPLSFCSSAVQHAE